MAGLSSACAPLPNASYNVVDVNIAGIVSSEGSLRLSDRVEQKIPAAPDHEIDNGTTTSRAVEQ